MSRSTTKLWLIDESPPQNINTGTDRFGFTGRQWLYLRDRKATPIGYIYVTAMHLDKLTHFMLFLDPSPFCPNSKPC